MIDPVGADGGSGVDVEYHGAVLGDDDGIADDGSQHEDSC